MKYDYTTNSYYISLIHFPLKVWENVLFERGSSSYLDLHEEDLEVRQARARDGQKLQLVVDQRRKLDNLELQERDNTLLEWQAKMRLF